MSPSTRARSASRARSPSGPTERRRRAADADVDRAEAEAAERRVAVVVHRPWCRPCTRVDGVDVDQRRRDRLDRVEAAVVDAHRDAVRASTRRRRSTRPRSTTTRSYAVWPSKRRTRRALIGLKIGAGVERHAGREGAARPQRHRRAVDREVGAGRADAGRVAGDVRRRRPARTTPCTGVSMTTVNGTHAGQRAAAVDVGLAAVADAVAAARRLADAAGADAARAVAPMTQPSPCRTGRARRTAAVDVGLGAVLHAVGAGRRLADAVVQSPLWQSGRRRSPRRRRRWRSRRRRSRRRSRWPFWTPSAQLGQAVGTPLLERQTAAPGTERCWILLPDATV